jgi:hypothetical protein
MKVVATRNFSNGLDKAKSKLKGSRTNRTKRSFIRKTFQKGKSYDCKEDEIDEALHFGWLIPAGSAKAEAVVKSAENAKKAKEAKAKVITAK